MKPKRSNAADGQKRLMEHQKLTVAADLIKYGSASL
jgi:hypothetical protein